MSILDVTEEQIFRTLGRGKDPNFKPIEKARPALPPKPKKTYPVSQTYGQSTGVKNVQEYETSSSPEVDESMKKLTSELSELNNRLSGIQIMVKWYLVPQFVFVVSLLLALFIRST